MGRRRVAVGIVALVMSVGGTMAAPKPARADGLTMEERRRLATGNVIKRDLTFERDGSRYVGGVSYAIVQASPGAVMAALLDARAYRSILPLTLEAREVARRGHDRWVALRHGGRLGTAGYTVTIRHESSNLVRFWLDRRYPHEIDDAWGYFRVDPLPDGATLVSYGAALNLGFGVAQAFFEEKIRGYALEPPGLLARYVEDRERARYGERAAFLRRSSHTAN
jgi:hypothetical protein